MGSINWKDLAVRAAKTFVAAFVTFAPVTSIAAAVSAADWNQVGALALAGASAGAAALVTWVWNLLLQWGTNPE